MKTAIALRHIAFEDLGSLEPILMSHGYQVSYIDVGVTSLSTLSPLQADLVIVLGGPISAYDVNRYPFLQTEISWLRARMVEDLPTLGICLGAQLMAAALNARVYPGAAGKEIGWSPLCHGADTAQLPYFDALIAGQTQVLHWHGDTFDLPAGARHLAASERYPNQAFSWGNHCLALQFHPEFEVKKLESWLIGHAHEISLTRNVSLTQLRQESKRHGATLERAAKKFWHGWLADLAKNNGPATTRPLNDFAVTN